MADRRAILDLIEECKSNGASQEMACSEIGVSQRTVQRWAQDTDQQDLQQGPSTSPANRLTDDEKSEIIRISTSQEF